MAVKHENRAVEAALAGGVADFKSAGAGQHHIEDEQVERPFVHHAQAGVAVARGLDGVAFRAQQVGDDQEDAGPVFDDEDAGAHVAFN
ncbi:MAG: hypothetical protein L0Z50_05460 [Verrucomicrobiales bacterium]|nr:hypothetical protein [Verrucomicrobiales bacterium]